MNIVKQNNIDLGLSSPATIADIMKAFFGESMDNMFRNSHTGTFPLESTPDVNLAKLYNKNPLSFSMADIFDILLLIMRRLRWTQSREIPPVLMTGQSPL